MARSSTRAAVLAFDAITIEGSLIAPAMVARVAHHDADEQRPADYGVPKGLTLRDEIARFFRIGQAYFADFTAAETPAPAATINFIEGLLRDVFGFSDIKRVGKRTVGDLIYPISLESIGGRVPVVVVPPCDDLDRPSEYLSGAGRRRSAASAIQDWLNANEASRWGLCSNGLRLRLVRNNASFTRPAHIEADLRAIFEEEAFADFAALWLLIHASRFGAADAPSSDSALERWREAGAREGLAARDRLGDGVEAALLTLGNGFLAHPGNTTLRERLEKGDLPLSDYFGQLLRLVYRMIFLLAAEDRGLLHAPKASADARKLYADGYSLGSLRDRAVRRAAWDRHHDRWEGLLVTFAALARGEKLLGLPALGGLFEHGSLPDLEQAKLANRALMEAIYRLAWLREPSGLVPVNWRDMETEELGSVYEGLLELTPQLTNDGRGFTFAEGDEAKGHARKSTGSYYTPDSLVQALLDSALDPVLDRFEAEAEDPAEALLSVTVIDPACGSGHFLLAAARRIATRLARARAEGVASAEDYRHALRDVARACLYGVDRNPMAVELAKVALWIETVEPGKPLGFLDANIRCGDALLGVFDLEALREGIPDSAYKPLTGDDKETAAHFAARNKSEREGQGALDFGEGGGRLPPATPLAEAARTMRAMPEDTPEEIEEKRKRFEAVRKDPKRWTLRIAADLYVTAFLTPKTGGMPANRNTVTIPTTAHVWDALDGKMPYRPLAARAQDLAEAAHAFHWPLQFPDIVAAGGFDVVLGNPPWERIKLQEKEFFAARDPEVANAPNAAARRRKIAALEAAEPGSRERELFEEFAFAKRTAEAASAFAREAGRFPLTGRGDINTYALFAELFSVLANDRGRAGVIVPTGIATDATTAPFFGALVERKRLARLIDFENRDAIFPGVHRSYKFCLLTIGSNVEKAGFAFFLTDPAQLDEPERRFTLSPEEIARINPNTRTAPVFRSQADANLTTKIYAKVPVFVDQSKGSSGNPWHAEFHSRIWHMAEDSQWFRTKAQLSDEGFIRSGGDWIAPGGMRQATLELAGGCDESTLCLDGNTPLRDPERYVPLYEAKMIHQFDHRWATYENADSRDVAATEKADPEFEPSPRYWVPGDEVKRRLASKCCRYEWLMGWRNVCRSTDARTLIATVFPRGAVSNSMPLAFPGQPPNFCVALLSNLLSITVDFVLRQKIGGINLTFGYLFQLPVLSPNSYSEADIAFINSRALQLIYNSYAMAPFARDLGYEGPPFAWDEERRALLRAELDAFYARKYGLTRDELRYILDPADVKGPDYPSETFRVLKNNDIKRFGPEDSHVGAAEGQVSLRMGTYRTARLVLQAWDAMERGEIGEVSAPATAPSMPSIDTTHLPDGAWATPAGGNVRDKTLAQIAAVLKALPGPTPITLARRAALYALEPRLLTARLHGDKRAEWLRLVGEEATSQDGVTTLGLGGATGWGEAVRLLAATGCLDESAATQAWAAGTGLDTYFTDSWPRRAGFALEQAAKILSDDSAAALSAEEEEGLTALAA